MDLPLIELAGKANLTDIKSLYICSLSDTCLMIESLYKN